MTKNHLVVLCVLFLRVSSHEDDEALVEIENNDESEYKNNIVGDNGNYNRNGKFLSYSNSFVDFIIQTPNNNVLNNGGDFFDFLRDSYPLPAGEYSFILFTIHCLVIVI